MTSNNGIIDASGVHCSFCVCAVLNEAWHAAVHGVAKHQTQLSYWTELIEKVSNLPLTYVRREDPLDEGMATHSSILAWEIPWTEEPGGLWFMGSQRVRHSWSDLACLQNFLWERFDYRSSVHLLSSNLQSHAFLMIKQNQLFGMISPKFCQSSFCLLQKPFLHKFTEHFSFQKAK